MSTHHPITPSPHTLTHLWSYAAPFFLLTQSNERSSFLQSLYLKSL